MVDRQEAATWAMIALYPPEAESVTRWVLEIFDDQTRRIGEFIEELSEPRSREDCVSDAEEALRMQYILYEVTSDSPPGFGRAERWWRLSPQY
jgi:hypothetical protein